MSFPEATARRIVLARAIETADTQGKLLSPVEREQIDQRARQEVQAGHEGLGPVEPELFLELRSQQVIAAVEQRNPAIAALHTPSVWPRRLLWAAPLATLVLGALTERIADPHRVDLLSLPLLAIVAWNLLAYVFLAGRWLAHRHVARQPQAPSQPAPPSGWAQDLRGWRRRSGQVRAEVMEQFYLRWQEVSGPLQVQRWTAVLHLAALGWAAGVAVWLLVQGLVVEYRVGWESTFLDARQVHAILSVLLTPVVALFSFEPFSVQEIAALQLGPGDMPRADRRWVWMYAALLSVVVIVPRALLAALASWRARRLARRVTLDLTDPYYQRVVSLLSSARVQLCLVTHRPEDRAALLEVLVQEADVVRTLISSSHGDVLRFVDLSGAQPPAADAASARDAPRWMARLREAFGRSGAQPALASGDAALLAARAESDVVLHVSGAPGDLDAAAPLLQWLGTPVLDLVTRADLAAGGRARGLNMAGVPLPFDAFASCWVQEGVLLDAIRRTLPQVKHGGFDRIVQAWDDRNLARFGRSMAAIAEHLLFAVRQVQEVRSGALTVKSLIPAERQAQSHAKQAAMDAVVQRLDQSSSEMFARLLKLHGMEESAASAVQHHMEEKFVVQQTIDTPQAGMAGAATGAAMGASVDLLVGGLTLGAATALGALVGGSAAYIGAAWKNRATAGGATTVQLSEEMMQAMVEAGLLRYLAVAHHGKGMGEESQLQPYWKSEVVAQVEARKDMLAPFWTTARTQPEPARLIAPLARELETMARKVLTTLHPKI